MEEDIKENTIIENKENKIQPEYKELTINGFKYKFKDVYKSGYCFRCMNRTICKLIILKIF